MADAIPHLPYRPQACIDGLLQPLSTVYLPLEENELRLLRVEGYDEHGILQCVLEHAGLWDEGLPSYAAISYTWNEADKLWYGNYDTSPKPIRINSEIVLVTDKVANILSLAAQVGMSPLNLVSRRAHRKQHGRKLVWIDAICINQGNLEEKTLQVTRMGKIYGCANEVLTFIGSPGRKTDEVLDMIDDHDTLPKAPLSMVFVAKLLVLFGNDYWRRAWVFQEVALAKTLFICCGSRIVAWEKFTALGSAVGTQSNAQGTGGNMTLNLAQKMQLFLPVLSRVTKHGVADTATPDDFATKGAHANFLEVLQQSRRHNGCSDPRDMLYSRIALASDAAALIPNPDYQISVEEVYKGFAANHILHTKSFRIIGNATNTQRNLPSWVPDWTSLHSDWYCGWTLAESFPSIQWQDIGLPQISTCRSEIMVQGKILNIRRVLDLGHLMYSALARMIRHQAHHPVSEIPRRDDLICVLRGFRGLVYLRSIEKHYIIVGRSQTVQHLLLEPKYRFTVAEKTTDGTKSDKVTLANIEDIQMRPEQVFRIR